MILDFLLYCFQQVFFKLISFTDECEIKPTESTNFKTKFDLDLLRNHIK